MKTVYVMSGCALLVSCAALYISLAGQSSSIDGDKAIHFIVGGHEMARIDHDGFRVRGGIIYDGYEMNAGPDALTAARP